ncbi:hypothetical protein PHSC3_000088 [Chlamydiales bacterium STE3]|nr:hypothetical protein PHSC3_000088 [Chlamydiales bacterium STE3]
MLPSFVLQGLFKFRSLLAYLFFYVVVCLICAYLSQVFDYFIIHGEFYMIVLD